MRSQNICEPMMDAREKALGVNVRRYPWYIFFRDCYFWGPAFFLYFTSVLTLPQALWLESVYYVAVAVLEVPSGYLSDRFGRKRTLIASSAFLALAYFLFWIGGSFITFAMAQVCLAAGFAFASGTDTALHYESLSGIGRSQDYAALEGRALGFSFRAGAMGALAGGLLATGQLGWIYTASFAAALVSLGIAITFTEPQAARSTAKPPEVKQLLARSFSQRLRFFTFYTMFMTVLVHFPYEFYQPYLARVMADLNLDLAVTPGATGVHLALTMFAGSLFTGLGVRIRRRCRIRRLLFWTAVFQVVLIAAMALVVHPLVAGLLVCRTLSRALSVPVVNAEISPLVGHEERGTYLSIQSLLGRLSYGIVLLVLPAAAALSADPLKATLMAAAGLGVGLVTVLGIMPFPRDDHHACCSGQGGHRH